MSQNVQPQYTYTFLRQSSALHRTIKLQTSGMLRKGVWSHSESFTSFPISVLKLKIDGGSIRVKVAMVYVFKSLLDQRIVFFQRWSSFLILATSLGSTSLHVLRLISGTSIKNVTKRLHTHTHTNVRHALFIYIKIENSDRITQRLVPVILKSAGGCYSDTFLFTFWSGIMQLKLFKSSAYDTA
jgi:hypothetical protein